MVTAQPSVIVLLSHSKCMNQCCVDYSGQYIRSGSHYRQHLDYVNQKVRRQGKRHVSQDWN